jgi:hypothetical protein
MENINPFNAGLTLQETAMWFNSICTKKKCEHCRYIYNTVRVPTNPLELRESVYGCLLREFIPWSYTYNLIFSCHSFRVRGRHIDIPKDWDIESLKSRLESAKRKFLEIKNKSVENTVYHQKLMIKMLERAIWRKERKYKYAVKHH